jgi:hypothetical protein
VVPLSPGSVLAVEEGAEAAVVEPVVVVGESVAVGESVDEVGVEVVVVVVEVPSVPSLLAVVPVASP